MSGNECGKIEQQIQKYNNTSTTGFLPTYVSDELGAECRCGCVIHMSKATRTLSATTKGCPGRSFWLIKVWLILNVLNFNSVELILIIFLFDLNKNVEFSYGAISGFFDIFETICSIIIPYNVWIIYFVY